MISPEILSPAGNAEMLAAAVVAVAVCKPLQRILRRAK